MPAISLAPVTSMLPPPRAAEIVDGAVVDGGARQRQGDAVVDINKVHWSSPSDR